MTVLCCFFFCNLNLHPYQLLTFSPPSLINRRRVWNRDNILILSRSDVNLEPEWWFRILFFQWVVIQNCFRSLKSFRLSEAGHHAIFTGIGTNSEWWTMVNFVLKCHRSSKKSFLENNADFFFSNPNPKHIVKIVLWPEYKQRSRVQSLIIESNPYTE